VARTNVTIIRENAMKNLVLSALLFAGLTQAAGCIIVADDTSGDGTGDVTVSWSLKSSDASGNVIAAGCPAGGDTVQIIAQRGDDLPFTDTFFCSDGAGVADRLPAGNYLVWIQITDGSGVQKFAESSAFPVVVADGATTPLGIDIFTNRAFFQASWTLNGAATTCAAAGATNVSVLATVSGGVDAFDDDNAACSDGEAGKQVFTQTPVPLGAYTVVLAALDSTGASVGDSQALTNKSLDWGNEFENLGTVQILIP
jgi:hypothetical protein